MTESPESILAEFIKTVRELIPCDGLEGVAHYFEHDEFEMAYEGLVLELLKSGKYPDNFDYNQWKELAIYYNLDSESVFDGQFWRKFVEWGTSYQMKS